MARLLVTGGAGYIGSHTVRALRAADHDVVALDDLRDGRADFVPDDVDLVEAATGDRAAVKAVLGGRGPFDGVLHFAASISVAESVTSPLAYWRNNVADCLTLVEETIAAGVDAFVFSSTAAVYGHPDAQPIAEDAPVRPINPYGSTKAAVERFLADARSARMLRSIALRYFNACGAHPDGGIGEAHDPETHLIPLALAAVAGDRPALKLFGTDYPTRDGTCVRDYIHVVDLARAHVVAVEALMQGHGGGAYNCGTGVGTTNREVLDAVAEVAGRRVPVEDAERRAGDPAELRADPTKFSAEFGWEPTMSDLETVVSTAWDWYRELRDA
jgi:UDP-glucose-4-epimerase GalE